MYETERDREVKAAATEKLKRCLSVAYAKAMAYKAATPGLSVAEVLCYQNDALLRAWEEDDAG